VGGRGGGGGCTIVVDYQLCGHKKISISSHYYTCYDIFEDILWSVTENKTSDTLDLTDV